MPQMPELTFNLFNSILRKAISAVFDSEHLTSSEIRTSRSRFSSFMASKTSLFSAADFALMELLEEIIVSKELLDMVLCIASQLPLKYTMDMIKPHIHIINENHKRAGELTFH